VNLAVNVIELTDRGRELEPVLVALARWGTAPLLERESERQPLHELRPPWLGMALRTYFDAAAARGRSIRIAICLPGGTLSLGLGHGRLQIAEGEPTQPADLRIVTSEHVLLDVLRGKLTLAAAKRLHGLKVEGEADLWPRLVAAFPLGSRPTAPAPSPRGR
jgi:hypothetical protein